MKLKSTLIAAFSAAAMATSQAFVIDFNDINQIGSDAFTQVGSTIGSSTGDGGTGGITIDVAGYGSVTITQTTFSGGSDLIIGNLYSDGLNNVNSIQLSSNGDQVTVTFPTDVILFNAKCFVAITELFEVQKGHRPHDGIDGAIVHDALTDGLVRRVWLSNYGAW